MSRFKIARWGVAVLLCAGLLPGVANAAATPTTTPFDGMPAVGALSSTGDVHQHGCSASIVDSPHGNLIISAAHCLSGRRNFTFAPGYHDGQTPYGVWHSVGDQYLPAGWANNQDIDGTTSGGSPYDYGFVVLAPQNGKNIAQVTGASLRLTTGVALPQDVNVVGYPSPGNSARDTAYQCGNTKASANGQSWMTLQCLGVPGGFSGGPWIAKGTNNLIGVIGGRGQNLPPTDARNYSVRFDNGVKALYDQAAKDEGGFSLGGGGTWKHADLITSGYYTGGSAGGGRHMDMIVKWSDGEVTLYRGSTTNNGRPFEAEYQLAPPNSIWTHAVSIAGGHFAAGADGLVVRWSDGELTKYTHVDQGGFHGEVQLAAPNATWQNAKLIAAGSYTGNGQRDDLVVVWVDGEVSLYSDLGANGVGAETQVQAPNGTWTHAETISGGAFTGRATSDLIVRWSDGELTIYPGVDTGGLHGEVRVQAPNSLWTHATVVSAGAFAANGRPNDLVVRWSDGEVSLYPAVDSAGLHAEVQLVAPE